MFEFFKKTPTFDFLGKYKPYFGVSVAALIVTLIFLFVFKLNLGLDFTGGTLVELSYQEAVDIARVRQTLQAQGYSQAVVQRFGTAQELMVRVPLDKAEASTTDIGLDTDIKENKTALEVIKILRGANDERLVENRSGQLQQCVTSATTAPRVCHIQVKRIEYVGPQVGEELAWQGGLALLIGSAFILIYLFFRFEIRFAAASIIATTHDVLLIFGFFSITQLEFDLTVLAATLAVLGYSLNDTVVIFDRIRENFRLMRRVSSVTEIMNISLNQTLSRTIITSGTTFLTVLALFFLGGEIIHNFSIALIVGIIFGTYSSLFIAPPVVLMLGVRREDLLPVKKEGEAASEP
jgi:preprotein translocase subunit SecF